MYYHRKSRMDGVAKNLELGPERVGYVITKKRYLCIFGI